jgi:hypothetical protein
MQFNGDPNLDPDPIWCNGGPILGDKAPRIGDPDLGRLEDPKIGVGDPEIECH